MARVTFPNQTPDQVAAINAFEVNMAHLFADRVHVTEQVLNGVGAPLAVSFNISKSRKKKPFLGKIEKRLKKL